MMKFCSKCKSLMMPKKSGSKVIMACTQCSTTDSNVDTTVLSERSHSKHKIEVMDPSKEGKLPLTDEQCPKCNHKRAYYWLVQTRAADESATKFMKCEKCEHTWRDYS